MEAEIEEMHPVITTAHAHTIALMLYAHNVPKPEQIKRLFNEFVPSYQAKQCERLNDSFPDFWFGLDDQKQRQYLSHALDAYAENGSEMANRAFAVASGMVA